MAKSKFYAVKNGRKPGIYNTWAECEQQVKGYASAVYKSFTTLEEAEAFMSPSANAASQLPDELKTKIYVDGSFDVSTGRFSYGMVVLSHTGGVEKTFNKAFNDPSLASMRNVAGEIKGSMAAMQYCLDNNIKNLIIYYDYEGIAKWALHEWKTNKDGTKAYAEYFDKIKDKLNVEFRHIKGHSGDKYNEMADRLAKEALGLI